jgi:chromosome segregation ATPase
VCPIHHLNVLPGAPYDRGMEERVSRLEDAMRDNTAAIARIDVAVAEIRATFPSLATKAKVAQLATKAEIAPLATRAELVQQIAPLATKAELAQQIAQLATKAELAQQIAPLGTKAEIAQLATKAEIALLASQIAQHATKAELADVKLDIAALSARFDHWAISMDRHMATKEDIAELRGYVKGLPTTWVMVTAIVAGQIGITGVIAGALLAAARMFMHT